MGRVSVIQVNQSMGDRISKHASLIDFNVNTNNDYLMNCIVIHSSLRKRALALLGISCYCFERMLDGQKSL